MGFSGSGIFNNDHCLDVCDGMVSDLQRQIEDGVRAVIQAVPLTIDADRVVRAAPAREDDGGDDAYQLLVLLDERLLAPIAMLTALCCDSIVRAMPPESDAVTYWHDLVRVTYGRIREVEQRQPPRQEDSMLANEIPGRAQSPAFWVERERTTDELFTRLAKEANWY
jgi:hypothetical protein